jgi:probable HAF family extracellular repeat protein
MVGLGDLPGGLYYSTGKRVSDDGSVIVGGSKSTSGLEAYRWTAGGGMVGLGDLPGGDFRSVAMGISADGSFIVGYGKNDLGTEAFRYTVEGGMVGLGDIPGGGRTGIAYGVSADGSVIVGDGYNNVNEPIAFYWTAGRGPIELQNMLEQEYGLDLTGWTLTNGRGISDDGLTVVGYGTNPDGDEEGWVATIPRLGVLQVSIDIKPRCCPNPLSVNSQGVLTVAILGTEEFDVGEIDVESILLEGAAAISSVYKDVSTPIFEPAECECTKDGTDGFEDLVLKFETQAIVEILGEVSKGDVIELRLTGVLIDETEIEGTDCVVIQGQL